MDNSTSIQCPHCGEYFTVPLDASEGSAEFVVDCEVCCRPMTVIAKLREGELVELEVEAD